MRTYRLFTVIAVFVIALVGIAFAACESHSPAKASVLPAAQERADMARFDAMPAAINDNFEDAAVVAIDRHETAVISAPTREVVFRPPDIDRERTVSAREVLKTSSGAQLAIARLNSFIGKVPIDKSNAIRAVPFALIE